MYRDIRDFPCKLASTYEDQDHARNEAYMQRHHANKYAFVLKVREQDLLDNYEDDEEMIEAQTHLIGKWGVWISLTDRGY